MAQIHPHSGWHFWIDRGGTFTDIVAISPAGQCINHKILSENPQHYSDAAIQGIRDLLNITADKPIPGDQVAEIRMGTTVATNALLERRGAKTGLIISRGFKDALRIGYQNRPDIFALKISRHDILYSQVEEIDERVTTTGKALQSPIAAQVKQALQRMKSAGVESIAIAFMHSYKYPDHELQVARYARECGLNQVYCSHQTSPLIKFISRSDTTVADAYLSPVLHRYVNQVNEQTGNIPIQFMQSSGGLCRPSHFHGKDAVLSGPAGGIIGMAHIATESGLDKVIGFDMGGTSTDVSHYMGDFERDFDNEVASIRLRVPMMRIHTVAAGGGSILKFDGARYQVGPDSAGADPGPACYRNNGPLTVTDCNVMLGKLRPEWFPAVFGPSARQALDTEIVSKKFARLTAEINTSLNTQHSVREVAAGFLAIAIDNMAAAIKKISIERGYNIQDYTLCSFGGAGGQHACLVAASLGMKHILIHPQAGVLSALGIGIAKPHIIREAAVEAPLTAILIEQIQPVFDQLEDESRHLLTEDNPHTHNFTNLRHCHIHYQGADTQLLIDFTATEIELRQAFNLAHKRQFGFINEHTPLIIAAIQVEVIATIENPWQQAKTHLKSVSHCPNHSKDSMPVPILDTVTSIMANQPFQTPVYQREALPSGHRLTGPALIIEANSTIVVEPDWEAEVQSDGALVLRHIVEQVTDPGLQGITSDDSPTADPVLLEVFNNRFMSLAEQMGAILQSTARSVNIKERLDFSCAIFDAAGQLLANAPHIPVHIGSMSDTVKSVITEHGLSLQQGDIYLSNNPYNGGTHLPDLTVIRPVFIDNQLTAYVAARGHHADIGGITPGSMPAHSTCINEEGIVIDNKKIMAAGGVCGKEICDRL